MGRRYRCTMRVDCGRLDPGVVIRPVTGEWHPRMPERLDEEEADRFKAFNEVYKRYFPKPPPARIFFCVPEWTGPFDVEVDCVAVTRTDLRRRPRE